MRTEPLPVTSLIRLDNRREPTAGLGFAETMTSAERQQKLQAARRPGAYVPFCILLGLLALEGCARTSNEYQANVSRLYTEPAPTQAGQLANHRTMDNLAYEHTVSIELGKALLPTRVREIQGACQTDKQFGCTLLDISVQSAEDIPHGSIRIRLAPAGVDAFIGLASKNGKVTSRNTHAEDLAEQVTDTERELALLTTHRDRLSEFMKDKSLKVDQLIAVSKELASAQTQIESASTIRANLHRRIDTHLLTLNLSIPQQVAAAQRTPIRDAFSSFGSEFTEAIAQVIRFVAVLIPWLIVIVPGLILIRLFWRGIGRWLSRRDAS
jgi:hypothetical protein